MNNENLLRLVKLLERDANDAAGVQFDMNIWGKIKDQANPISCGTQACAMGLAALSGEFAEEGLTAYFTGEDGMIFHWHGIPTDPLVIATNLFGISITESYALFLGECWLRGKEGELAKANQIRQFVGRGAIIPIDEPEYEETV